MNQTQMKKSFLMVLLAYLVSATSVILVPFAIGENGDLNMLGYISGAMFWIGLIVGIAGYLWICRKVKLPESEGKKIPEVFRFFSNPWAVAVDIVLIVGVIGAVICWVTNQDNAVIQEICLVCLLIGIYGHTLLNGRIYQYIWNGAGFSGASDQEKEGERE